MHAYAPRIAAAVAPLLPETALADWDRTLQAAGANDHYIAVRQAIAEARGDLDLFLALDDKRPDWRQNPLRAAEKLLAAGRLDEALVWARREHRGGIAFATGADLAEGRIKRPHDLQRVDLEARIFEAQGDRQAAQALRWQAFETTLDPKPLRDYLKKLDDFEEDDEIERAFAVAEASLHAYSALAFFISWPNHDRAAKLVVAKPAHWDGRHYGPLGDAAAALDENFPLAASVLYRALLNDILGRGKSPAYGHGTRYLAKLATLEKGITEWENIDNHVAYALVLRKNHGRKAGFWSLTEAKHKL